MNNVTGILLLIIPLRTYNVILSEFVIRALISPNSNGPVGHVKDVCYH